MNYKFMFKIVFQYNYLSLYMCHILAHVLPVHSAQTTKQVTKHK